MSRYPYSTPRLRRLGNVADITQGTGTGPGDLGGLGVGAQSTFGAGTGSGSSGAPVKIYGDYSPDQVGGILNGGGGK